ncbi:hypothetical protein CSC62_14090 [Pseudoxanthomonas jiangsuensis]|uniref:gp436 family protein n=1 Tax=Pseudoxanthomonas jiangsuensis TaxID=619688 RepID=UPI001391A540|nr:DUF1320 domain-containing protein [Pseudoxanthomonas jiangsuensis]KAF1692760.1 hypothetical protein CSC62_14090 [Pseudoxanthomonas jiangsuensis]
MAYVTLPQLAEIPGALELAQVATNQHAAAVVDATLMEATLRGSDRSAWSADEIDQADKAAARISEAVVEAGAVIDGYLARRYTLPLASTPGILVKWARSITRYTLHADRISDDRTDPVARDYRDAIRFLELIAAGKFSLGLDDPTTGPAAAGEIQINPGHKVFGREHLP